jgi:hypothetical protein
MTSSLPFAALFLRLENFFWSAIRALYRVQVLNIVVVIPSLCNRRSLWKLHTATDGRRLTVFGLRTGLRDGRKPRFEVERFTEWPKAWNLGTSKVYGNAEDSLQAATNWQTSTYLRALKENDK